MIGSHFKYRPNAYIIKIPSQKLGTVIPIFASVVMTLSSHFPRLIAAMIPAEIPMILPIIKANPPMYKLMGRRRRISFSTGERCKIETPRSPWKRPANLRGKERRKEY